MSSTPRLALFLMASTALLAVAFLLGGGAGSSARPVEPPGRMAQPRPAWPRPGGETHGLLGSARRFLVAFTRYEVGEGGSKVLALLRRNTTRTFAGLLLRDPPRVPSSAPTVARLRRLSVAVVSRSPLVASVAAVALRPSGPEQLDFLFTRRDDVWLASAPGE